MNPLQSDILRAIARLSLCTTLKDATGAPVLGLSGVAGIGVDEALHTMLDEIERRRAAEADGETRAYSP